jgi:hypothetical protein
MNYLKNVLVVVSDANTNRIERENGKNKYKIIIEKI